MDKLSFNHGLKTGDIISNGQLIDLFKCSARGGMRRSHKTNTLVIISDHTKSLYEDRWIEGIFHYTGMGMEGNQDINFAQNKTLSQTSTNKVEVYLFEVFEEGKYVYIGQVQLGGQPYQEEQPDIKGNIRKVWVFPLKIIDNVPLINIDESVIQKKQKRREEEARRLSDDELEKRARYSKKGVGSRQVSTVTYERNVYVAELAKRKANGICQLCENPAPFSDKKGYPFLETHHIEWLSKGGQDVIENTVALCPNCHRKMHSLNLKVDKDKLNKIASVMHL